MPNPMGDKVKILTELVNTLTLNLRKLTLRNLLVLALLIAIIIPTYIAVWFLQEANRPFLLEVIGNTKILAMVDNCPVIKTSFQGKDAFTVILPYNTDELVGTYYLIGTIDKLDTKLAAKSCGTLNGDRGILRDYYLKKDSVPSLPKLP